MPTLKYFASGGGPRLYSVHKPVTTIGRGLGNDVAISGAGVREHHAQLVFDGRDFVLEECEREGEFGII
jgi:pSer/pThr/pTyr-binding forkhead associated (FHA) protein